MNDWFDLKFGEDCLDLGFRACKGTERERRMGFNNNPFPSASPDKFTG